MTVRQLQNNNGNITIAAFDQRGSLAKLLGVDPASESGRQTITRLKELFMETFSPICSAVLVDPEFGLSILEKKDPKAGLLLSLERSSYDADDKDALPLLYDKWGVREITSHGAAVKLLVFYHPESHAAKEKLQFIRKTQEECKQLEVPFLVEPLLYEGKKGWSMSAFDAQLRMVQDLAPLCDVLKLEFPLGQEEELDDAVAAKHCEAITKASSVPWVLLSRGMGYERFIRAVEIAMKHGAHGIAVGRAVWKEVGEFATWEDQKQFIQSTAKERMERLVTLCV